MRKIIIFLILLFSSSVFADTYPAHPQYYMAWGGNNVYSQISYSDLCSTAHLPASNTYVASGSNCYVNGNTSPNEMSSQYGASACPYGGTLSGTSCVNADPCTAPQVRNTTTGMCETPPPVTCQTTPTTTTSGSTQTLTWETLNTGSNTCDPHSLNCDYPLAVNATTKQCDLSCPDGSTVDVSAGAQCPPPSCPNQVNGNMITKQAWNSVTQKCENSDIVYCDGQLQVPDAGTGTCLPKPGAIDCGNGVVVISPVKCSSEPDHSQDITCPDGTIISPPRVCAPLPPDPANCPGGASAVETTGYVNGVPTCIMKDGTKTAAADGSQSPADDKYNPQSYKAGVACNSSNSYPCDPSLPVVSTPGLTGIEKCGPGTFFQCADKYDKPVIPALYPKSPAPTTATTTTTGTGTTTIINSDGSTSTQTTTTNNTGTTTTTGGSTAGLATEDTAREIASRLGGKAKGTGAATGAGMGTFTGRGKNTNPNLGKWYEATTDTYEGVFQTNVNSVKDSPLMGFSQKIFNVSIPGGTCPIWTIPAVMNMQAIPVSALCSDFMDSIFPIISALVQASAVFMVFKIIISGFKS
ncbi:hypothetical protein Mettu_3807 [Methylobacter tundripaludum SV96]|uniref:TspB protein n=2 Tax=Methylobacter tundripaludum TaxID=173365 RepID=G3J0D6_METTV|nr:hypothetical protein Mettu_3807 [Methylobacter tundripaludum SV96]